MSGFKSAARNESPALQEPDPQGQAALLLMDSLIHALIDAKCLITAQAVELIQRRLNATGKRIRDLPITLDKLL